MCVRRTPQERRRNQQEAYKREPSPHQDAQCEGPVQLAEPPPAQPAAYVGQKPDGSGAVPTPRMSALKTTSSTRGFDPYDRNQVLGNADSDHPAVSPGLVNPLKQIWLPSMSTRRTASGSEHWVVGGYQRAVLWGPPGSGIGGPPAQRFECSRELLSISV
jgi:hypothetical protein